MADTIRLLLADDHPTVRIGIRAIVAGARDLHIVGEAANGQETQRLSQELCPDVLLLDLSMPGPPAIETIAYLKAHCPQVRALILTAYDNEVYVRGALAAGAAGYVLKDEAPEALIRAIRSVAGGDGWFSRRIVDTVVRGNAANRPPATEGDLTERECEVLRLVASGCDNAHIASQLALRQQTVRNYLRRIYGKLGVHSRAEAVVWARARTITGE